MNLIANLRRRRLEKVSALFIRECSLALLCSRFAFGDEIYLEKIHHPTHRSNLMELIAKGPQGWLKESIIRISELTIEDQQLLRQMISDRLDSKSLGELSELLPRLLVFTCGFGVGANSFNKEFFRVEREEVLWWFRRICSKEILSA